MPINFRNDVSFSDANNVDAITGVGYSDNSDVSLWRDSNLCAVAAKSLLEQDFAVRRENSYTGMQRSCVFEEITYDHGSCVGNCNSTGANRSGFGNLDTGLGGFLL
jgi:hypothetical protein